MIGGIVDCVVSMVLWVVSGVYLWRRRTRNRRIGYACAAGGLD